MDSRRALGVAPAAFLIGGLGNVAFSTHSGPAAAVPTMASLAARADQEVVPRAQLPLSKTGDSATARATHAVVGLTDSGFTTRALVRWRSPLPLAAATRSARVVRQLRFAWGVTAVEVSRNDVDGVLDELVAAGVPGARASDTVTARRTGPRR